MGNGQSRNEEEEMENDGGIIGVKIDKYFPNLQFVELIAKRKRRNHL